MARSYRHRHVSRKQQPDAATCAGPSLMQGRGRAPLGVQRTTRRRDILSCIESWCTTARSDVRVKSSESESDRFSIRFRGARAIERPVRLGLRPASCDYPIHILRFESQTREREVLLDRDGPAATEGEANPPAIPIATRPDAGRPGREGARGGTHATSRTNTAKSDRSACELLVSSGV